MFWANETNVLCLTFGTNNTAHHQNDNMPAVQYVGVSNNAWRLFLSAANEAFVKLEGIMNISK